MEPLITPSLSVDEVANLLNPAVRMRMLPYLTDLKGSSQHYACQPFGQSEFLFLAVDHLQKSIEVEIFRHWGPPKRLLTLKSQSGILGPMEIFLKDSSFQGVLVDNQILDSKYCPTFEYATEVVDNSSVVHIHDFQTKKPMATLALETSLSPKPTLVLQYIPEACLTSMTKLMIIVLAFKAARTQYADVVKPTTIVPSLQDPKLAELEDLQNFTITKVAKTTGSDTCGGLYIIKNKDDGKFPFLLEEAWDGFRCVNLAGRPLFYCGSMEFNKEAKVFLESSEKIGSMKSHTIIFRDSRVPALSCHPLDAPTNNGLYTYRVSRWATNKLLATIAPYMKHDELNSVLVGVCSNVDTITKALIILAAMKVNWNFYKFCFAAVIEDTSEGIRNAFEKAQNEQKVNALSRNNE